MTRIVLEVWSSSPVSTVGSMDLNKDPSHHFQWQPPKMLYDLRKSVGSEMTLSTAGAYAEVGHDCDCAPLWNCVQEGRGGCEALERGLRSCLARQKVSFTGKNQLVQIEICRS